MPCQQITNTDISYSPPLSSRTGPFATEADCLNACKEGACCEGTTCSIKPQCQCQGTGQTFKGIGTTCTPSPCESGACCEFDGSAYVCRTKTKDACDAAGGFFRGGLCSSSVCQNPCTWCCSAWPLELAARVQVTASDLCTGNRLNSGGTTFFYNARVGRQVSLDTTVTLSRISLGNSCYEYRFSSCGSYGDFQSLSVTLRRSPSGIACVDQCVVSAVLLTSVQIGQVTPACAQSPVLFGSVSMDKTVPGAANCVFSGMSISESASSIGEGVNCSSPTVACVNRCSDSIVNGSSIAPAPMGGEFSYSRSVAVTIL